MITAAVIAAAALLLLLAGQIWMIVVAFCRHVLWGLAVLLVPFAALLFLFVAWSEARRPFFLSLAGGALALVAMFLVPREQLPPEILQAVGGVDLPFNFAQMMPKKKPAELEPSLPEKLAGLRTREQALLARKAQLRPEDRPSTEALAREIQQYNAELQPVLAALEQKKAQEALPADAVAPAPPRKE